MNQPNLHLRRTPLLLARLLPVSFALAALLGSCAAPATPPPVTPPPAATDPTAPATSLTLEPAAGLLTHPQETRILTLRSWAGETAGAAPDVEWISSEPDQFSVTPIGNGQARVTALTPVGSAFIVARSRDGRLVSDPFVAVSASLKQDVQLVNDTQVVFPPVVGDEPAPQVFSEQEIGAFIGDGQDGRPLVPYILRGEFAVGDRLVSGESSPIMGQVLQVLHRDGLSLVQIGPAGLMSLFQDIDYRLSTERLGELSAPPEQQTAGKAKIPPLALAGSTPFRATNCQAEQTVGLSKLELPNVTVSFQPRFEQHLKITSGVFKGFDITTGWNMSAEASVGAQLGTTIDVSYTCGAVAAGNLVYPLPGPLAAFLSIAMTPEVGGKIKLSSTVGQPASIKSSYKGWNKLVMHAGIDENFNITFDNPKPESDHDSDVSQTSLNNRNSTGEYSLFVGLYIKAPIDAVIAGTELFKLRLALQRMHLPGLASKIDIMKRALSLTFVEAEVAAGPTLKVVLPRSVLIAEGSTSEGQGHIDVEITPLPGLFERIASLLGTPQRQPVGFDPLKYSKTVPPVFYQPLILNHDPAGDDSPHPVTFVNGTTKGNAKTVEVHPGDQVRIVSGYIYNLLENAALPDIVVSKGERYVNLDYQQDIPVHGNQSVDEFTVDAALCDKLKTPNGVKYAYLGYNKLFGTFDVSGYGGDVTLRCTDAASVPPPVPTEADQVSATLTPFRPVMAGSSDSTLLTLSNDTTGEIQVDVTPSAHLMGGVPMVFTVTPGQKRQININADCPAGAQTVLPERLNITFSRNASVISSGILEAPVTCVTTPPVRSGPAHLAFDPTAYTLKSGSTGTFEFGARNTGGSNFTGGFRFDSPFLGRSNFQDKGPEIPVAFSNSGSFGYGLRVSCPQALGTGRFLTFITFNGDADNTPTEVPIDITCTAP